MSLTHTVVATGSNDAGKQVSVTAWNADHAFDMDGVVLPVNTATTPTAPAAGSARLACRSLGNRLMLTIQGPSGTGGRQTLMPHVARNGAAVWIPAGGVTTIQAQGAQALIANGTPTTAAYAVTNLHTQSRRVDYLVTTAATTAVAGYRATVNTYRTNEGFHHIFRVCPATGATVGTRRFFCGMAASAAQATDVQPSSQLNIAGVGYDAADTTWQFMFNDGAGAATKVNTTVARPAADRQSVYTVMVFCPPGGASIGVTFCDEANDINYTSVATTDLIAASTALGPRAWSSVGGTSSVTGVTLFGGYMETDS